MTHQSETAWDISREQNIRKRAQSLQPKLKIDLETELKLLIMIISHLGVDSCWLSRNLTEFKTKKKMNSRNVWIYKMKLKN